MVETPVKIVVDLSKPKGQRESIIPLTKAEIAQREAQAVIAESERVEREALEADKAAAKESANDKLAALGLSPEEIAAITGA
jgi:hypothetical protein|tara:strand:+ start:151 stop:396 length:246 start_codon:yes stop_codon:yes gene_type:complete